MTQSQTLKLTSLSSILISLISVATYLEAGTGLPISNTVVLWSLESIILIVFWKAKNEFFDDINLDHMIFVKLYLIYNVLSIMRGVFVAETYWDWKGLAGNSLALLIPFVAYVATNERVIQRLLVSFVKYGLAIFLVISFFIPRLAYGFYLVPISFLILLIPSLPFRFKFLVLVFTGIVLIADTGSRSNVIKFFVPLVLLIYYKVKGFVGIPIIEFIRKILFGIPFLFLYLGIAGIFNVFNIADYIQGNYVEIKEGSNGEVVQENLKDDTRTFLYVEVLNSAVKYNSWIFGRSPARGNETETFADSLEFTGRSERLANEVAILNIFTWSGVIGLLFFLLVFYRASYLSINFSQNVVSKIMGLFIAFRWIYAWVEDVNLFSITTFFIWFMIGLSCSHSFRNLTDKQMVVWARGIFDKRYRTEGNMRRVRQ
jgi:hypothetical protein